MMILAVFSRIEIMEDQHLPTSAVQDFVLLFWRLGSLEYSVVIKDKQWLKTRGHITFALGMKFQQHFSVCPTQSSVAYINGMLGVLEMMSC